ncbi:hypothetical protein HQ447_17760 [bacterium]|nr:hypothetical protein [bacterium]
MKITNKLGHYLALTLGAGAAATSAEGATTVTVYGQGVTPPAGINPSITSSFAGWRVLDNGSTANNSFFSSVSYNHFTSGTDWAGGFYDASTAGYFQAPGTFNARGATSGDANYANISLNGNDGVYEAVGQFHITAGELWLIALAKNDNNSALSISAGKTAIDGAATSAVPEVSGHLALLALGSAGVLTRRRLKRAA